MQDKKPRLATLDDVEKEMKLQAERWHGARVHTAVSSELLRDFSDSLSVLAREVRALRESQKRDV